MTTITTKPEKKVKAKARHEHVATKFEEWLAKNPNALHDEIFRQFDLYCDSAVLDERLKSGD